MLRIELTVPTSSKINCSEFSEECIAKICKSVEDKNPPVVCGYSYYDEKPIPIGVVEKAKYNEKSNNFVFDCLLRYDDYPIVDDTSYNIPNVSFSIDEQMRLADICIHKEIKMKKSTITITQPREPANLMPNEYQDECIENTIKAVKQNRPPLAYKSRYYPYEECFIGIVESMDCESDYDNETDTYTLNCLLKHNDDQTISATPFTPFLMFVVNNDYYMDVRKIWILNKDEKPPQGDV